MEKMIVPAAPTAPTTVNRPNRSIPLRRGARCLLAWLLLAVWGAPVPCAYGATSPNVLIVDAGHVGFPWSDQIRRSLRETLDAAAPGTRIFVEAMDRRRFDSPEALDRLADLMADKYRHLTFGAVVAVDRAAVDFLGTYRRRLVAGIPTVVCGLVDPPPADRRRPGPVTGVGTALDIRKTITLALGLLPDTRRVVVPGDTSAAGRQVRQAIARNASAFAGRVEFIDWADLSRKVMLERLAELEPGDIVLTAFYHRDGEGRFFNDTESIRRICNVSPVPVFGLFEFDLGLGILGGQLASGADQGRAAGQLVLRILNGERAGDMPWLAPPPNPIAVDANQLRRFAIDPSRLPARYTLINAPTPTAGSDEQVLKVVLAAMIFLLVLVFRLLLTRGGQHRSPSERLYRRLFESLPEPTFAIDRDHRIIAWNRAAETLYGVRAEDIVGKGNYAYQFYGEHRPITIDLVLDWDEAAAKNYVNMERRAEVLLTESVDPVPALARRHYRNVAGPLHDEHGHVIGAIESVHDITYGRIILKTLQGREELLRFFVSLTPVAVAMVDREMNYLFYSRRWITDFNLPDEDLTGRCHEAVFGALPEHWKAQHRQGLQGQPFESGEESFTGPDGSVEWVRRVVHPWLTPSGTVGGLILLMEKITERKLAEAAAIEMESRMRAIGDRLPGGLIFQASIRPDGSRRFTYISGGVTQLFGCTAAQVMDDPDRFYQRIAEEDRRRLFASEATAIRNMSVIDEVVQLRLDGGAVGWQRLLAKPRRLDDGDVLLDGITIDMTHLKQAEQHLRLMEAVVQNSPVVLFRWRAAEDWPVDFVSDNVAQFGYRADDLTTGRVPFATVVHPDDLARVAREVAAYTAAGKTHFQQEYRILTASGETRWVDDRTLVERRPDGTATHFQGVVFDITERKQAQQEIVRRQLFLESVLHHAPDAIITLDDHHRVIDWNPGAEKIFGYTQAEVLGRELDELVSRNDMRTEANRKTRRVLEGHRVNAFETVRYRKDGRPVHVIAAGSPIMIDGTLTGVVAMYSDITALKQAEAELRRNERRLRRIIDIVPSMIFVKNAEGRFLMANKAVAESYGTTVERLVGRLQADLHPDSEQVTRYLADDAEAMQNGRAVFVQQEPYRTRTGSERWMEVVKVPCDPDDFGEPAIVGLATDITERRAVLARIEESERRYRTMFENTGTGTVLSETDTTLSMVNTEFARMVGYRRDEIEGKMSWTRFIVPEDVERMKGYHYSRRQDPASAPTQWECSVVDRDGRIKRMLLKVRLIPGTQTSIGSFLDISERKRAEEALKDSHRMLRLVLDTIPVRVFWKDTNCRYLGCNQAFAGDAGFSDPEHLIGRDDYALSWVDQADSYRRDDQAVMATGLPRLQYEEPQTSPDGGTIWLQTNKVPMRDSQDRIIGVLGTYQDITERKAALEELQRLRNYLFNIINSMPSVLVGVDVKGRVTQWNKQAERLTGISYDSARQQPLETVFPQLIDEAGHIRRAIRDRQVIRDPKIVRRTDSGVRYEEVTIFPLQANGMEGAVIRVDDVTERVRLEEMMIQSEKMLSVGGLAAGMAHEINNPLAGILQNAAVLENRLLGTLPANAAAAEAAGIDMNRLRQYLAKRNIPDMVKNIRDSGNRAAEIVRNMLSFARKSDRIVSTYDLGRLLDQTIELVSTDYDMKKRYDFKQINIIRRYDPTVAAVPCEASKIQQVFLNILKNGAEAMASAPDDAHPPTFILELRDQDPWVRVEISDNGPGMNETTRRRIFEPFFTTKPIGEGTGLGLSVSYFIITENHGGKMDVESAGNRGTRFVIRLPKTGKASPLPPNGAFQPGGS